MIGLILLWALIGIVTLEWDLFSSPEFSTGQIFLLSIIYVALGPIIPLWRTLCALYKFWSEELF